MDRSRIAIAVMGLLVGLMSPAIAGPDSDGDGMPDRWERIYKLDPHEPNGHGDPDHDDLSNLGEYRHDANPRDADTDDDGTKDGREVKVSRTDPNNAASDTDSNADGIDDEDEDDWTEGCSKDDPDSDGDGVDDEDENDFGSKSDDADSDGDGRADGNEDLNRNRRPNEDEDDSVDDYCWKDGFEDRDDIDAPGLMGRALAGPTCPVQSTDDEEWECDDRPVRGAEILIKADREVVARTVTRRDGWYAFELDPGTYRLVPQPVEGLMGTPGPQSFTVHAGDAEPREIDSLYDTGIR